MRGPIYTVSYDGRTVRPWLDLSDPRWGLSVLSTGRERGVIAVSAGNHAQGVALAAATLGVKAVIVMAASASETKIAATAARGRSSSIHRVRTHAKGPPSSSNGSGA